MFSHPPFKNEPFLNIHYHNAKGYLEIDMQFTLKSWDSVVAITSNTGEEIAFDIASYRSTRIEKKGGDIFKTLNDYIPRMKPTSVAALFGLYLEAKTVFMLTTNTVDLEGKLENIFRKMFNLIDIEQLKQYISIYSGIIIPPEIKNNHAEVDSEYLRDKTYVRDEYIDLLTYTVADRLCLPIWAEYMSKVEATTSSDGKEFAAYSLLRSSKLRNLPAYNKLLKYVIASTNSSVETSASTLKGVGRDSIPEWLTAMVIVRKLPVIDLLSIDNRANIINAVYSYVDNHLKRLPKKFMDDARERKNEGAGGSDENEQSYVETYRAKQQMAYGDLETNIIYLEGDLLSICHDVDPTFEPSILDAVLAVSEGIENSALAVHNHVLTQWVMDTTLDTLEPDTISRVVTTRAMIVTQAVLHHWGLHNLALLATGVKIQQSGNSIENIFYNKLTNEQVEQLEKIYPNQIPNGRQPNAKNKNANYGYLSVIDMSKLLTRFKYAVRTPAFLTSKDVSVDRFGHLAPPPSISHELVTMLIKLDTITPEPVVL